MVTTADISGTDDRRRRAKVRLAAAVLGLAGVAATAVAIQSRPVARVEPPLARAGTPAPRPVPSSPPATTASVAPVTDPAVAGRTELVAVQYAGARTELVLVSTKTGRTTRRLRFNVPLGTAGGAVVDLSPDRRTVYYSVQDHDYSGADGVETSCGGTYALTLADGIVRPVDALAQRPRVSPDGRRLAMLTGCPVDHLTILDLRTGARRSYPLAPALKSPPPVAGAYLDPVRDLTWTARGTLAILGWDANRVQRLLLFDPRTDRRLADVRPVDVDPGYWQVRAYGDDLMFVAKYAMDVRDGATGRTTRFLSGGQDVHIMHLVAVGPDGTVAYERDGRLWFAGSTGRHRPGPPLRGRVADW